MHVHCYATTLTIHLIVMMMAVEIYYTNADKSLPIYIQFFSSFSLILIFFTIAATAAAPTASATATPFQFT